MDIKKKADLLVLKHQSRNPFDIIKGLNVISVFVPLTGVRGFYQYFQRNNIIYIEENLSDHDRQFVCAHELGHMLMHKKANTIFMDTRTLLNTSSYEKEANTFAMNLLVSDELILEYQEYSMDQLSRILDYRKELIELRLK